MFHEFIRTWFEWVEMGGYWGVFGLMAMESSIIPVPSEVVMAPAAFWASQGRMNFWGVVLAGTLGSYAGSLLSYLAARWLGHPFLEKYGKYFFISEKKLKLAESWIHHFGTMGVFICRFLPVVRHLVSLPAGVFRMPLGRFSLATLVGSGIWCWILAWFGQRILGKNPRLLESPETMILTIQGEMGWFVAGSLLIALLYGIAVGLRLRTRP